MTGSVVYRLPYQQQCTFMEGQISVVDDSTIASPMHGYIIAPFLATASEPSLLIHADNVCRYHSVDDMPELDTFRCEELTDTIDNSTSREAYQSMFEHIHDTILDGRCSKIVLARQQHVCSQTPHSPINLFRKACQDYPRLMIILFSTPLSGMWLVATPEVLVERKADNWQTMALAGTQQLQNLNATPEDIASTPWSAKNIQEQKVVERYIDNVLRRNASDISIDGPHTVRAAHLLHLRTDFHFTPNEGCFEGSLLRELHPTPAVCGLPCDTAYGIINRCNSRINMSRHYFSGYSGPVGIDNESHVFVTLRCMQIHSQRQFTLHAGGGIMPQSDVESEWMETETKMDTMRRLIGEDINDK